MNINFETYKLIFVFSFILILKNHNNFDIYQEIIRSPKISIYLPIFNKGKFLKRSINSIQKQTLKDIEIVAVNDNSSDNSLQILIEMSKKDKRIKVVNNIENRGTLYSKGIGILKSNGEYLMNLDPDDEINGKKSLQLLYNKAKKFNADMIFFFAFNTKTKIKSGKFFEYNKLINQPKIYESAFVNDYLNIIKRLNDFLFTNKLVKKELAKNIFEILKPEIYGEKWCYHEDNILSILAHKYSNYSIFINKIIYIYHQNEDSSMSRRGNILEIKNILDRNRIYKKLFQNEKSKMYAGWIEVLYLFQKNINIIKEDKIVKNQCIKEMEEFKNFINYNKFDESKINDINELIKKIQ